MTDTRIAIIVIISMWIFFPWAIRHQQNFMAVEPPIVMGSSPWVEELNDDIGSFIFHQGDSDNELFCIPTWRPKQEGKRRYSSWDVIAHAQHIRNEETKMFFSDNDVNPFQWPGARYR